MFDLLLASAITCNTVTMVPTVCSKYIYSTQSSNNRFNYIYQYRIKITATRYSSYREEIVDRCTYDANTYGFPFVIALESKWCDGSVR